MHKIILTSQARRDMHQIKDYISRRLQNPIAAKNTLSALIKEFRKLEQFPAMGPVVLDEMGAATSERVLACKNYLAFISDFSLWARSFSSMRFFNCLEFLPISSLNSLRSFS